MKKFRAVHEQLRLLCPQEEDANNLMAFSDFMVAPDIRISIRFSQNTRHSPSRKMPLVQHRTSFHPYSTYKVPPQANTPTSYIQHQTPVPRHESAPGYCQAEPLTNTPEDPGTKHFSYVTTRTEQPRNIRSEIHVLE